VTTSFSLHPRLAADCAEAGDLPLCRLLLMRDRRFPWCILVPRIAGLTALHQVPEERRMDWFSELDAVSRAVLDLPGITRINVGALGNLVPQLHVHVIGRHPDDAAWPGPVWGSGPAEVPPDAEVDSLLRTLRAALSSMLSTPGTGA
jgi:diadenosine tetraphosphate (Ap4A) HIT family hydrolase